MQKGFSFIELALVLLIAGVIVAGIIIGDNLIEKSRLKIAQNLTKSSEAAAVEDMVFWLDITDEKTLRKLDQVAYGDIDDDDIIVEFKDKNQQLSRKINLNSKDNQTSPIYDDDAINGLPALYFDGIDVH